MIGVIDADANVISCSDTSMIGEKWPEAVIRLNSAPDSIVVVDKKTFKPLVSWSAYFDYAVFAEGDDETARSLCVMAYVALNGAKTYYEEKHDKGTFVKNIITDNILPGDVYIRAKELHFVTDVPRAVFLVRQVGRADVAVVDLLAGMFPDRQQDFVLSINEKDVAIVKQITPTTEKEDLLKIARQIEQTLHTELFIRFPTQRHHVRRFGNDCCRPCLWDHSKQHDHRQQQAKCPSHFVHCLLLFPAAWQRLCQAAAIFSSW